MASVTESKVEAVPAMNDLVAKAKAGDTASFAQLVAKYQKGIFMLAYGYFMNRDDALEIVQETFLKAFSSLRTLRDDSSFEGWLYRIATNLSNTAYRKKKKIILLENENILDKEAAKSSGNDVEVIRNVFEVNENLRKAIRSLPKQQKTIIVMRYFQDMKLREIAEKLGLGLGTVKKHHFRAIKSLREMSGTILKD